MPKRLYGQREFIRGSIDCHGLDKQLVKRDFICGVARGVVIWKSNVKPLRSDEYFDILWAGGISRNRDYPWIRKFCKENKISQRGVVLTHRRPVEQSRGLNA